MLSISILGANYNKEVWGEDAATWKPERWLKKEATDSSDKKQGLKYPGVYGSM